MKGLIETLKQPDLNELLIGKKLLIVFVHTQYIFNGLNLYLGSQLICIVGFEFPTMGSPLLGDPIAHSSFRELLYFSFLGCSLYY